MWVKDLVKIIFLFSFFNILSTSSLKLHLNENETESDVDNESLPSIWDDEVVTRMVREVLARDLYQENEIKKTRRQYKREVHSSATVAPKSSSELQTTRKMASVTTQKVKKPSKVTQTGNKNKNRVTLPASITSSNTTKATVKPNVQSTVSNINLGSVNSSLKIKPITPPTKYHYYPHNQHPYILPECAVQQVCNAVYARLNYTQPLCVCPPRYRDPCSASLNEDDNHTITLVGNANRRAVTLAKTCEQGNELRDCRAPRDWSILALQNTRTGKSHYLVICKCPGNFRLDGPLPHDQPTYAGLPGINVFGMLCVPFNTPAQASKWHPVIHTSYRSKNTTIEAINDNGAGV
ncbi:hypothetical protein ACKWTF_002501 [Chironomus riparius]